MYRVWFLAGQIGGVEFICNMLVCSLVTLNPQHEHNILFCNKYFMKHSPSWEANASLTRQETHILWKLMVHYSVHKSLVHVSELTESIPSHPLSSATLIAGFHLSLGLAGGIFPLGFSTKTLYTFFFSLMCTMPHKSHYHWKLHRAESWTDVIGFLIIEF